jgi:hypothetical protein
LYKQACQFEREKDQVLSIKEKGKKVVADMVFIAKNKKPNTKHQKFYQNKHCNSQIE